MNLRSAKMRAANLAVSAISGFLLRKKAIGARVPVLCYHRVLPELAEGERPIYSLTPREFATQMNFLARNGFQSLSLDEYVSIAMGWAAPPERGVMVTFDDGFADNFHLAWAITAYYGIKLNLFICTGLIEGEMPSVYAELPPEAAANRERYPQLWAPLTWSEIRQMAECGVGIGFHSHSHGNFGQMTTAEMAKDVARGLNLIEARSGLRPKTFAFPGGSSGSYNSAAVSLIKGFGLQLLFTTHLGRTRLGGRGHLFSRLVIYQEDDLEVFQRKLFGGYDWLGKARSIDQSLRSLLSR
jgi:peptidoglycan/xylan/chitin deacetylase (PgdA/CDA1 family)